MTYRLRLVAYADDTPEMKDRIRSAIEDSGGQVESSCGEKTTRGAMEMTFAVRIEEPRLVDGIASAVERLRCVAVMRVTEPRPIRGLHRV